MFDSIGRAIEQHLDDWLNEYRKHCDRSQYWLLKKYNKRRTQHKYIDGSIR